MSRFLFAYLYCQFVPMAKEGGVDIVDLIANTYSKVHKLPATIYKLNSEAFKKFAVEFDRLRINSLDTSRKGWERNVWSKAGGQLGRLILNLHLIWLANDVDYFQKACQQCQQTNESQSSQGVDLSTNTSTNRQQLSTTPIGLFRIDPMNLAVTAKIPPETVEREIELIRYFVDQSIGLIAEQSGELSPQLTRILELSKKKGSVTPRIIIHSINGKNRPTNTKQAIELLKELTAMGYGRLEQKNRIFVFTPNSVDSVDSVDNLLTDLLTTQSVTPIEVEAVVDIVDTPHSPLSTIEQIDPKPPTIDRPIPEIVKHDDWIEYKLSGDLVEWIHIAFHQYAVAKDWGGQIELWGGKSDKPHKIKRNGKKWLLRATNIPISCLDRILNANLGQSPQAPSRRAS
jgi:hypothetical protein